MIVFFIGRLWPYHPNQPQDIDSGMKLVVTSAKDGAIDMPSSPLVNNFCTFARLPAGLSVKGDSHLQPSFGNRELGVRHTFSMVNAGNAMSTSRPPSGKKATFLGIVRPQESQIIIDAFESSLHYSRFWTNNWLCQRLGRLNSKPTISIAGQAKYFYLFVVNIQATESV